VCSEAPLALKPACIHCSYLHFRFGGRRLHRRGVLCGGGGSLNIATHTPPHTTPKLMAVSAPPPSDLQRCINKAGLRRGVSSKGVFRSQSRRRMQGGPSRVARQNAIHRLASISLHKPTPSTTFAPPAAAAVGGSPEADAAPERRSERTRSISAVWACLSDKRLVLPEAGATGAAGGRNSGVSTVVRLQPPPTHTHTYTHHTRHPRTIQCGHGDAASNLRRNPNPKCSPHA
jgi:hypothetical protein